MYTTSAFLRDTRQELLRMSIRERIGHAALWTGGLILINVPALGLTFGIFHGNDGSLLVPSGYGFLLNAVLFYGNSALIRRWWRQDPRQLLGWSAGLFLAVGLLESALDAGYYRLFYGTFRGELVGEILLGTLLMNGFLFYAPSFVYGIVKAGWSEEAAAVPPRILVKDGTAEVYLDPDDLFYVESDGNYAVFHTGSGKVLERKSLKQVAAELPPRFVRCHRSYVVNTQLIEKRSYQAVTIGGREIPVGRKYGKGLAEALDRVNPRA